MTAMERFSVRFLRRAAAPLALSLAARLTFVTPVAALGSLLGAVAVARPAAAAPSSSAQARSLFMEARRLMDKGRFAEACPKLQESLRIDPGMGTQFNLAHCWEKLGLTASAWGLFLDVAAAASNTGQAKREKAARDRAEALEPKLSRLRIDVPSPARGMSVLRAGEEVGQGAWGAAMPIDAGSYHIEAVAPDKRAWSGDVVVEKPGETVSIEVPPLEELTQPVVEAPSPEPESAPVAVEDGGGSSTGTTVGAIVLGAVGVGGIVTGIVFGMDAKSETDAARGLCTGGPNGSLCNRDQGQPGFDGGTAEQNELNGHRDNASRSALIGYVGFGVGAAALVGGALLLLTSSGGGDSEPPHEATLVPVLGPEHAGIQWSGHF